MKKLLFAGAIFLIIVGFLFIDKKEGDLVDSSTQMLTPTQSPVAVPVAPKTFQFDSSTDLEAELEKVNPQILDSDFE